MSHEYTTLENKYRHSEGRKMDYFSDVDEMRSVVIPDHDANALGIYDFDSNSRMKGPMSQCLDPDLACVFILNKNGKHYLVNTEGYDYCRYIRPCTIEQPVVDRKISAQRIEQLRAMAGNLNWEELNILVSLYGLTIVRDCNREMILDEIDDISTLGVDMVDHACAIVHDTLDDITVQECIARHNLAPYYDIEVTKMEVHFKNP